MTSFIVISTTESLNRFVDDIALCRPQNPVVASNTHIGTGKLLQKDDGLYYYYTYGNSIADNPSGTNLYQLLANQIANFRLKSNLGDNELQIFLLENPITADEATRAELVFDSLQKVITEKKYENNCHIVRVVFSYDVNSLDVTAQVSYEYLSHLLTNETATQTDIYPHILYLDNQDRHGAALTSTKEEHDLLIPRMLCDFMMLYSSENNSYYVRNASHNAETQVFSIGYAECMYYFKDIERFYGLAYNRDIRKRYLNCPNDGNRNLDYKQAPLGLIERKTLLFPRYADVPYSEDINEYEESVDKEIDDIVRSHKQSIIDIKARKLKEAIAQDEEATEDKRQKAIDEGEDPEAVEPITQHVDVVNKKYPDYIERSDLYNLWLIEHTDEEKFDDNAECSAARLRYERLLNFIQSAEYKDFIINPPAKEGEANPTEESIIQTEEKGCNLFARIFHRNKYQEKLVPNTASAPTTITNIEIVKVINSIATLLKEKERYCNLCEYIKQVELEVEDYQRQIDDFRLTTHSKSVDNLINLKSLKDYQSQQADNHIDVVINKWREFKDGTLSDLMQECDKECAKDVTQYKYIDWDYPFVFVNKDIDISNLAQELNKVAIPFIQTYTTRSTQENLTTYCYYHDREEWKQQINDLKSINMPSDTTTELSTHIESKFCMFQILQMDNEIIKGLTDLHAIENE